MNYLRLPTGGDGRGWSPASQHAEEKSKFLSYSLDLTYHHLNFLAPVGNQSHISALKRCPLHSNCSVTPTLPAPKGFFLVKAEQPDVEKIVYSGDALSKRVVQSQKT